MYRLMFILLALIASALLCSIIPLALLERPVVAAWAAGWAVVAGLGALCALDADERPVRRPAEGVDLGKIVRQKMAERNAVHGVVRPEPYVPYRPAEGAIAIRRFRKEATLPDDGIKRIVIRRK